MPIRTSVEDLIITCSRMKAAQQACSQHVFDAPLPKHSKASGTVFGGHSYFGSPFFMSSIFLAAWSFKSTALSAAL
jgi:hypothetical protein